MILININVREMAIKEMKDQFSQYTNQLQSCLNLLEFGWIAQKIFPKSAKIQITNKGMKMYPFPDGRILPSQETLVCIQYLEGGNEAKYSSIYIQPVGGLIEDFNKGLMIKSFYQKGSLPTLSMELVPPISLETLTKNQPSLDQKIIHVLIHKLGMPAHTKGFRYMREIINMIYHNMELLQQITKFVYPTVANKFNTTSSLVERAVRHGIDVAWERSKRTSQDSFFDQNFVCGKPSNSVFLAVMVDYLIRNEEIEVLKTSLP